MQMMLGTCTRRSPAVADGQTRSSPADADDAHLFGDGGSDTRHL